MNREELIEAAADAMFTANDGQPDQGYDDMARAALAVFEQAHTPTDDERETLLLEKVKTAGHVMSETMRFADFDYPVKAIPYSRFLEMLAGFRRPVQGEPSDAEAWAAARAVAALRKSETGAPAWFNVEHARAALRAARSANATA